MPAAVTVTLSRMQALAGHLRMRSELPHACR
jgi:hypothetical protein